MDTKLTGTAENFMHAHYLASEMCNLEENAGGDFRCECGGEDGFVTELIPYGLILGKVIDVVYEECKDFDGYLGTPSYEVSDNYAPAWLFGYLQEFNRLPDLALWEAICLQIVRGWVKGTLPKEAYKLEVEVCAGAVVPTKKEAEELFSAKIAPTIHEFKDHEIREFVNDLRDVAQSCHGHDSLRSAISNKVHGFLTGTRTGGLVVAPTGKAIDSLELTPDREYKTPVVVKVVDSSDT